jgi:hypothetical protein
MSKIKENLKLQLNKCKNIPKIKKSDFSQRKNFTKTELSLMSEYTDSSQYHVLKKENSDILNEINELSEIQSKSKLGLFKFNSRGIKLKDNVRLKTKLKIKDESLEDPEKYDPILMRVHNFNNNKNKIENYFLSNSDYNKLQTHKIIKLKEDQVNKTPQKIMQSDTNIFSYRLPLLNSDYSKLNNTQRNTTQSKLTLSKLGKMSPASKQKVLESNLLKSYTNNLDSTPKFNNLKMSPNLYKTEVKIRENININISKQKSNYKNPIDLNKNTNLLHSLSSIHPEPIRPSDLVNETYHQIRISKRIPKLKMLTKEEIMEIKNNSPGIIPMSNLFEINHKLTSTLIAKDPSIIRDIYNQNITVLKKFIQKKLNEQNINN